MFAARYLAHFLGEQERDKRRIRLRLSDGLSYHFGVPYSTKYDNRAEYLLFSDSIQSDLIDKLEAFEQDKYAAFAGGYIIKDGKERNERHEPPFEHQDWLELVKRHALRCGRCNGYIVDALQE